MFVLVGVTGGIAAYKTVQLVRALVLDGHDVHVVPTDDALRFVGTPTWESISRNSVTTSVHDDVARVRHVALGRAADLVIVAPATANFLAKMAAGLADDLLGTSLLATTAPVVVAPAMHTEMWRHPATQHNVRTLTARGVVVAGPEEGPLTGGDSGPGRMTEPDVLHALVTDLLAETSIEGADDDTSRTEGDDARGGDLAGLRVLVSAGGTREPIDPVRFIGNRSSGRQGVAVAVSAAERGADVTLVAAHVESEILSDARGAHGIEILRAGTADELQRELQAAAPTADVIVMAAAVADYRVADVSERKLSKEGADDAGLTLDLVQTPDILRALTTARTAGQTIIGFAAETPTDGDDLLARARRKRARKQVDLLVVNEVGWSRGFETAENEVVLLDARDEVAATVSGSKRHVADALWDAVLEVRGASDPH